MKSLEILKFIKSSNKSYSKIIKEVKQNFGIQIHKSLVSYYKRKKSRINPVNLTNIFQWEWEWLVGLFFADGCKYFEKHNYSYTIKFSLDFKNDKDIADRLIHIFKTINLKPTISKDKQVLIIRVFSKLLFNSLPSKGNFYKPQNKLAFLAGMVDGDGAVYKHNAVISQQKNQDTMIYLSKKLDMTRAQNKCTGTWGEYVKITYYLPVKLFNILLKKKYSIKINRNRGP